MTAAANVDLNLRMPSDLATRAALVSLISNFLLMVLKVFVGIMTGSVAVLSDGIDSGQDVIASSIALFSVRVGRRPPDVEHPYGHGRAETVAALTQGLLIAGGGVYIVFRGVLRLINPPDTIGTDLGLIAMALTAGVNLLVVGYVSRIAKQTHSPAITSDARHLWTNVVQAGAVLAALGLVAVTDVLIFDPIVALMLAAYLLWTAGGILWTAIGDVMDMSLDEEDVRLIEEAILSQSDKISGFHRLRTRRSGQHRYIDFHLILPGKMTIAEAHPICDSIESRILELWPTTVVTIHVEPEDGRFRGPLQTPESRGREGERPARHHRSAPKDRPV